MSTFREYTVEVVREQRQTVTFVADTDRVLNNQLTDIAAAQCTDDDWSEFKVRSSNLRSVHVEIRYLP